MVDQGNDGKGVMTGILRGSSPETRKLPFSHVFALQLTLIKSLYFWRVLLSWCVKLYEQNWKHLQFSLASQKPGQFLLHILKEEKITTEDKKLKKKICPTILIEHHNPVQSFVEFLHPIYQLLDEIKSWIDKKPATEAQFLQSAIKKMTFY